MKIRYKEIIVKICYNYKVNKKINVRDWSEILDNIKISIRSIMIYILIMIIGEIIINSNLIILDYNLDNLISISIIELISSGYLLYIIKKFYIWEDIGFSKINKKNLIWFVPYIFILIPMIYTFIEGIYKNISSFDSITWISIFMILIGTITAGFSEEVMFRGMLLNDLKNKISLKNAMIISSLGFSILHITTIFSGKTLIEALANVIVSSLLGFSFAPLAIILNNILPLVIFHILWNFIIIASSTVGISISKVYLFCNPINIIISIILWIIIIKKQKKSIFTKNKLVLSEKLINSL